MSLVRDPTKAQANELRCEVVAHFALQCGCVIAHKVAVVGPIRDEEDAKRVMTFAADMTGYAVEKRLLPGHRCPPPPLIQPEPYRDSSGKAVTRPVARPNFEVP